MWTEVHPLEQLDCWEEIIRSEKNNALHIKSAKRGKRNKTGGLENYKAELVVFGNDENNIYNHCFSPVVHCTMIKLLFCMAVQNKMEVKNFDIKYPFPNG